MSWTDYINYMLANNVCEAAAILNAEDGSLVDGQNFTVSSYNVTVPTDDDKGTRNVSVNEPALVLEAFKDGKTTCPAGFRLSGIKWQIVMADLDGGIIYLKKEKGGACMVKTAKTIVIGSWHSEKTITGKNVPQNPGDCNKIVEGLAKILRDAGY